MACVRKRRGKWIIDYRDASGKRRWETVEGNRKDAEERLAKIFASGKRVIDTKRAFKDHATEWLNTYARTHVKESTFREYEAVFKNHVFPVFGRIPFSKVTREMVKRLIAEKIQIGLSRSTVKNIIVPLREMYNHAIDDGVVSFSNPASRVGRFNKRRGEDRKITPLTREELSTLLDTAVGRMPHYYPLLLCAARTGMREGELIALQWGDVDFSGRLIEVRRNVHKRRIPTPKSGKTRRVDMSLQLTNILERLLAQCKANALKKGESLDAVTEGWVFTTPQGTQLDPDNLRKRVFYRALAMAGLRRVRFHDLRHTYASLLIQQGESLAYVKDQLGHSSIQITVDTYGHLVPGGNRQAVDKLDDVETDRRPDIGESGSKMVAARTDRAVNRI